MPGHHSAVRAQLQRVASLQQYQNAVTAFNEVPLQLDELDAQFAQLRLVVFVGERGLVVQGGWCGRMGASENCYTGFHFRSVLLAQDALVSALAHILPNARTGKDCDFNKPLDSVSGP